jgi:hypothetical protein
MNVKSILPIEFHKFITRRNFEASSDSHYFKHQIIRSEIVEKYGELTDDGYFELTKRGGGKLRFDEVYGYEWVIESNNKYRDPEFYNTIPAYSISTVVDELLKYGIYVYVDLTEDGFVGRVTTFRKNINPTPEDEDVEDVIKNFSFTSGINSTGIAYDNMYDAYEDIIRYTIKSYNWKTMTKKENDENIIKNIH